VEPRKKPRLTLRLIQREAAEHYLLLTMISFAASITLTRLFLSLTNYPQLGGDGLHIAHVLWGGLLLYIAALLPLLFANRGTYTLGAVLAGVGIGLFIDEVGKFITQQNNYFFPAAAAIIYVCFLLTVLLFLNIRRGDKTRERDELMRDFEDIWEMLHNPLPPKKYLQLKTHLESAVKSAPTQGHADLATALLQFLDVDEPEPSAALGSARRFTVQAQSVVAKLFSHQNVKIYLIIGLLGIGLLNLKNPVTVLLAPWLPSGLVTFLDNLRLGSHPEIDPHQLFFSIRVGLEVLVGLLFLLAAFLLIFKRDKAGIQVGYAALLISLTTVDVLLFYYEQFSTILTTLVQFLLLIGISVYRRHVLQHSPPPRTGQNRQSAG
jgi:hypothetical protein